MNSNMMMEHNNLVSNLFHCHLGLIVLKRTIPLIKVIILETILEKVIYIHLFFNPKILFI